jgi:hypothetical protein
MPGAAERCSVWKSREVADGREIYSVDWVEGRIGLYGGFVVRAVNGSRPASAQYALTEKNRFESDSFD